MHENIVEFPYKTVYQQIIDHCNTQERIQLCCKENNAFRPEMFDPAHEDFREGLIAIKQGEQLFSKDLSEYQCREDLVDHDTSLKYARQAKYGVLIDGKRYYGIRKPIRVIPRVEINSVYIVDGIAGWHRDNCSRQAELEYLPAILDNVFPSLKTKYEKDRYLRMLNAHVDNGLINSESDLMNGISAALHPSSGVLVDEVAAYNLFQKKLQDQHLDDTKVRSLKRKATKLKNSMIDFLAPGVVEESSGRWDIKTARNKITNVINSWDHAENSSTYTYSSTEVEDIYDNEVTAAPEGTIIKRHTGKANGTRRQLRGDLWDQIIKYEELNGRLPSKVTVIIALTAVGRVKNLHEKRIKFDQDLKRHINHAYPSIKVDCRFLGQAKSRGQFEETGVLYSIQHVKNSFNKFKK